MENNLKDQHYKNMGITLQMDTLTFEAESFGICLNNRKQKRQKIKAALHIFKYNAIL